MDADRMRMDADSCVKKVWAHKGTLYLLLVGDILLDRNFFLIWLRTVPMAYHTVQTCTFQYHCLPLCQESPISHAILYQI